MRSRGIVAGLLLAAACSAPTSERSPPAVRVDLDRPARVFVVTEVDPTERHVVDAVAGEAVELDGFAVFVAADESAIGLVDGSRAPAPVGEEPVTRATVRWQELSARDRANLPDALAGTVDRGDPAAFALLAWGVPRSLRSQSGALGTTDIFEFRRADGSTVLVYVDATSRRVARVRDF